MNAITTTDAVSAQTLEHVLGSGDLSKLTTPQRVEYYARTCQTLGLNPLTRPFRFLALNGQIQLYATRDCTDQLRKVHGITLHVVDKVIEAGLFSVTVRARTKDGREDEDIGAVVLPAAGESRANALMKAMTKAKRRVTLSICGLGITDESELDTMPGAMAFDADTPPPAPIRTEPTRREQINADVPLDPPKPQKLTWTQLIDDFERAILAAATADEVTHILRSNQMTEAKAHIGSAREPFQVRFDKLMQLAEERRQALADDEAEAAIPLDDDEDAPEIRGEANVMAGD